MDEVSAVDLALDEIKSSFTPEYQYLFVLAGYLRSVEPSIRRSDRRASKRFSEPLKFFASRLVEEGLGGSYIDWSDDDSVELEFEKAWQTRRLPKNTDIFEIAIEISASNPLGLSEERNKWINRVANLAFCLSELLPDTPMLIPVSDRTAEMLGTSLRTLSLAVQEVIRDRLVIVLEKSDQSLPVRRARRLKFNSKHSLVANDIDGARKRFRALLAERKHSSEERA